MRAILFARAARRIIIRLFFFLSSFFLSVAAVKEYNKMRGKGSNWRERVECVSFFDEAKEIFGCEKKRREILREEDKGDVVKCCYV